MFVGTDKSSLYDLIIYIVYLISIIILMYYFINLHALRSIYILWSNLCLDLQDEVSV